MQQAVLQFQSKVCSGGSAPPAIILCWQLACMSCDIAGCPPKSIRWVSDLAPYTACIICISLHTICRSESLLKEGIKCCPVGALGLLLLKVPSSPCHLGGVLCAKL